MRHKTKVVRAFGGAGVCILLCMAGCRAIPVDPEASHTQGTVPDLDVPRAVVAPVIDGSLSDTVWSGAALVPALHPAWKAEDRQLAIPPTTVRVLWDADFLYVAFECEDRDITCSGTLGHDDLLYKEDVCEVFLDGMGDGLQFVELQVNPEGVNLDLMYLFTRALQYTPEMRLTPELCERDRWKFLEWEMKGLRTAGATIRRDGRTAGWCVEMAIPAEAIMKRRGRDRFFATTIRANLVRYDWTESPVPGERELLQQTWSPVLQGNPHNSPGRMGRLRLLE